MSLFPPRSVSHVLQSFASVGEKGLSWEVQGLLPLLSETSSSPPDPIQQSIRRRAFRRPEIQAFENQVAKFLRIFRRPRGFYFWHHLLVFLHLHVKVVRGISQPYELVDASADTPDVAFRAEFRAVICNLRVNEIISVMLVFLDPIILDVRWIFLFLYAKLIKTCGFSIWQSLQGACIHVSRAP